MVPSAASSATSGDVQLHGLDAARVGGERVAEAAAFEKAQQDSDARGVLDTRRQWRARWLTVVDQLETRGFGEARQHCCKRGGLSIDQHPAELVPDRHLRRSRLRAEQQRQGEKGRAHRSASRLADGRAHAGLADRGQQAEMPDAQRLERRQLPGAQGLGGR